MMSNSGWVEMKVVKIDLWSVSNAWYRVMDKAQVSGWDPGLAVEAQRRLKQLDWFLFEVQEREVELARAKMGEHRSYEIVDEIQTLTEAFYYFAFRTMRMFQELPGAPGLPATKGFDAPGVRNVRNWLVEHPENPSRGFQMGAEIGPRLGLHFDQDPVKHEDAGLYVNAMEFREKLMARLLPYMAHDPMFSSEKPTLPAS
jgi:hypothetical protein